MRAPPTHIPEDIQELRDGYIELAQDYATVYQELLTLRRLAFGQRKESLTIACDLQTRMEGILGAEVAVEAPTLTIAEHRRKASRKSTPAESIIILHE